MSYEPEQMSLEALREIGTEVIKEFTASFNCKNTRTEEEKTDNVSIGGSIKKYTLHKIFIYICLTDNIIVEFRIDNFYAIDVYFHGGPQKDLFGLAGFLWQYRLTLPDHINEDILPRVKIIIDFIKSNTILSNALEGKDWPKVYMDLRDYLT